MSKNVNEKTLCGKILRVLSGYEIAIVCMLLLLVLTWFCTLEQTEAGLYWTLEKYFSIHSYVVRPSLYGKDIPLVLPGGYWVCAVFTLNLICGGVIRARKGWKHAFLLVSHMSMVFLMVAGAVDYHTSRESLMDLYHGDKKDYAVSFNEDSLEICKIKDGKKQAPIVVSSQLLSPLRVDSKKVQAYLLPDMPFDIEVSGYFNNALPQKSLGGGPAAKVVDGVYLLPQENQEQETRNNAGCYVKVTERKSGAEHWLLLSELYPNSITVTVEGEVYGFRLSKEIWPLPFHIRLDDSRGERHPGSMRPKVYESDVTVLEEGSSGRSFKIEMNEPLRYKNVTFYQTHWDDSGERTLSAFTVKTNPADQWPKYAIYLSGFALLGHFMVKLISFINSSLRKRRENEQ